MRRTAKRIEGEDMSTELLIVGPAARRAILAEAEHEGIDLATVAKPQADGSLHIDWGDLVEAIQAKKDGANA